MMKYCCGETVPPMMSMTPTPKPLELMLLISIWLATSVPPVIL